MALTSKISPFLWLSFFFLTCALLINITASQDQRKSYIVYMGDRPEGEFSASSHHLSVLQEATGRKFPSESLLYSFKRSFNGFVAHLTDDEARQIVGMDNVISVFPNEKKTLHPARSWDFLEFPQNVQRTTRESDIIIGILDTGIWPESKSFNDNGFGAKPTRWRGSCQVPSNFSCNNKIIGAKSYRINPHRPGDIRSPRDSEGHGTHTASTAAGNLVSMASLYGLGLGTARGGVPSARIAVYKICWSDGCYDADILAAFDDAIADGVDIISISVGNTKIGPRDYFKDSIAIGAFHAMKNGILTSASAGNSGPKPATLSNYAPWFLTVAASTIDRKFITKVKLGNQMTYEGVSINTFDLNNAMYPLIYGGDAPNIARNFSSSVSRFCQPDSLNPNLVKGKIVFCDFLANGLAAYKAGAIGEVDQGPGSRDTAYSFPLPASFLNQENNPTILSYIRSASKATATIFKSNEANNTLAPFVAPFSSRGPNAITPDVLKPDIAAPGVDILASWSEVSAVTEIPGDKRLVPFNIISGTSMACPHATGAAAYIKSYYPSWSPAAIKSALMATASPMNSATNSDAEFAYGVGQINPVKAKSPGLIYDITPLDYVKFLCGQGYDAKSLQILTGNKTICSSAITETVWNLNYPSFTISVPNSQFFRRVFTRTVTNVGLANSAYRATINGPSGLNIKVQPSILTFTSLGQKITYNLTVEGAINRSIVSASLVWLSGIYQVRSPIVVYLKPNQLHDI